MSKSERYRNTYSIANAMRSQLNTTIPEESHLYNIKDTNGNATPAGSYAYFAPLGYKYIIPLGLEIKKEIGNGDAETVGRSEV